MRLQLTIQQTQQYDITGNPIYFQGNNVNSLSPVAGALPPARQWPNYGSSIDVTDKASDLYSLKLTWTTQADNEGFIAPGTFNAQKGASGNLTFEAEAYQLMKQWLVQDVSAQLNSVDVTISHYDNNNVLCGTYTNWVIKATDLEWCEDGLCTFDTVMKQKDELYNCMRSTAVTDNWQDWFHDNTAKPHPRFSYCNEIRPNGLLIMQWYLMSNVAFIIEIVNYIIAIVINPLIFAINGIIVVINAIIAVINIFADPDINDVKLIKFFDPSKFEDNIGNFFLETAGCGREHPAPLYRDYITNVCSKCGIKVDASSFPILFAQNITIETSSRGVITEENPHYNACDLYTPSRKGLRRFLNLSVFGYSEPNTRYFIFDNRRLDPLDIFLDSIKGQYNAEWNLKNGTLYFQRKDFFRLPTTAYVLDLSENGADRNKLLEGICFTWNERKIPASVRGLYTQDGIDTCGDEARAFMNDIMSYGDATKNPVYDGIQDKTTQFGATKFRGDGVETDYIMDAYQICMNGSWMSIFIGAILNSSVKPDLKLYADYALLMRDDKNALPKILIWDGSTYYNARALKTYAGIDKFGSEPTINTKYNPKVYDGTITGWSTAHQPSTFVRGSSLTFGSHPVGKYRASDTLNIYPYEMIAYLVNYPMYMAIGFQDSMWDWFHWIDDPNARNVLNRTANAKIELCCDTLKRLRVFGNGNDIALGERVLLPNNTEGVISQVEVSYDPDEQRGQYIEIQADS